jgi:ion channel-forming bestrophin family protein
MIDYDSKNWLTVLAHLRGSVAPRLLFRTAVSVGLGWLASYLYTHHRFFTPPVAHTMVGAALGLLLVFRTNASFDRWWEGRKLLGAMTNRVRDVARQLHGYFPGAGNGDATARQVAEILRLVNAFMAMSFFGLQGRPEAISACALLTAEEKQKLEPLRHRAPALMVWVTQRLDVLARETNLSEARLLAIDTNLTSLVDSLGGCERIARTPIPLAYAQHIKLLVTLFCFTAPFALVDALKGFTPLGAGVLAYALLGIDEIGVEIEDPFGDDPNDLPMDRVLQTIQSSTDDIAAGAS